MIDLLVLVADLDCEQTLTGLLARTHALRTREFSYKILRHPGRDPGCRMNAESFLRPFHRLYSRAVVVFDHEGSGAESTSASDLELSVEHKLRINGWDERAAVVVVSPELENWVWSVSPRVDEILGWAGRVPSLRQWLVSEKLADGGQSKPSRPKEALDAALQQVQKRPSAAIFRQLAERISFQSCQDRALQKLVTFVQQSFPIDQ